MRADHTNLPLRRNVIRGIAVAALALPPAALAAQPAPAPSSDLDAESVERLAGAFEPDPYELVREELSPSNGAERPGRAGAAASPDTTLARVEARRDARAEQRQKAKERRESGPFHPVVAGVSYGDAQAAFGNARGRPHEGQDIFAPAGTKLVSPTETVVAEAGSGDGRGNWVALYEPAKDRSFVYFHMSSPASVEAGEKLEPGDRVGEVGCTGSCSGDHLHLEVRAGKGAYGEPTNPLPVIEGWGRFRG